MTGTRNGWDFEKEGTLAWLPPACEDSCSRSRVAAPTAYDSPAVSPSNAVYESPAAHYGPRLILLGLERGWTA